ncbi:hypothetical protein BJ944DRAFT_268085 [Cunninghamella echinulata]|nr:hypothetical protein BJ944DRAFT_268085 [Cunninghamella echinulata]
MEEKKVYEQPDNHSTSLDLPFNPPPAYQPNIYHHHSLPSSQKGNRYSHYIQPSTSAYFYEPTPPPQSVIVHDTPSRSKDACCWGCVSCLILCFGARECLCF